MSNSELSELEDKIRAADVAALAQWITLQKPRLLAALERKVGAGLRSKLELEDILQESAARAIKDLPSIDFETCDPIGWFYQVMDRQIVDLHRFHFEAQKRAAGREVSADRVVDAQASQRRCLADLLVASMTTPSAGLSRDMRLVRVYSALDKLSSEMQLAIRLRYLENLPSQQVATQLGKSDVATRVLLSRAIRKLKECLDAT